MYDYSLPVLFFAFSTNFFFFSYTVIGRSFELLHFILQIYTRYVWFLIYDYHDLTISRSIVLKTFYQIIMPSKIAFLTVAIFCASALAIPLAAEAGFEVEAREVDNDLEARDYDMFLEARDVEALDLEAREDLEELEAREPAVSLTE